MNKTLKCFISSSVEELPTAKRIMDFLNSEGVQSVVWNKTIFEPGMTILENLQNTISEVDFVIALLPSQEGTTSRARENIMFEIGLIIGMGKPLLSLIKDDPKLRIPADMRGMMYLYYDPNEMDANYFHIKNWIDRFLKN